MKPQLLCPLLISLAIHGLVLALFAWPIQPPRPPGPEIARTTLRIHLQPASPTPAGQSGPTDAISGTGATPGTEPTPVDTTRDTAAIDAPRVVETLPLDDSRQADAGLPEEEPEVEPAPEPEADPGTAPAPPLSTQAIREATGRVTRERAGEGFDCSPLQRRSELFDCEEQSAVDPERLTRNSTYEYFMPRTEPDRTGQTIERLTADADDMRENLEAVAHENFQIDGFLQHLQETSSARTSTTRAQRMRDMLFANDPIYQMMKRVMGQESITLQQ